MKKRRVPKDKPTFDTYIVNGFNHLNADEPGGASKRAETLGMTLTELNKFGSFKNSWSTGDPQNPGAYDLHKDPEVRSRKTTKDCDLIIKNFTEWFRPILVRISGSASITPGDRIALNIAEPVTTHAHPSASITEQCIASAKPLGGGVVELEFRYSGDTSRPSKPPNCDAVLIFWRKVMKYKQGEELAGKVRNLPAGPDDEGMQQKIVSRSTFSLKLGIESQDLELQFYVQFINTKHEELNGPVSGPHLVTIL